MKNLSSPLCLFIILAGVSSAIFVSAASPSVIINEIAWMGTVISYNDEWIELHNNTPSPINLDGWLLQAADGVPKINLAGVIPANAFYLLERSKDYTGALENSGETLEIYDNLGNLIDSVDASSGWPTGDNSTKQTMERGKTYGWQTSKNPGGTPKAENSVPEKTKVAPTEKPLDQKETENLAALGESVRQAQDKQISKASVSFLAFFIAATLAVFSGIIILVLKKGSR